ncbi:unnamed protein product [Miscanthus lutarioriparius]|uniref:Uncharacterized protein n=1 Tax=Miscanthus lutarioriparius TaxID=422564 RepID=A0A811SMT6_9POAL|nr:unnamed protein product [Miscanthus lutarioriparius]
MRPERGGVISVKLMGGGGGGGPPSLWKTPTPYVFLGIAIMMGVIAVALLVLICTHKKASSSSSDEKAAAAARALVPLDRVPKVVVFMPGDDRAPSFLASVKPLGGDGAAAVV